jgi:hypothetical protein
MREYLETCITSYYSKLLSDYSFDLVEMLSEGIGALNSYRNNSFNLRIVNDRGVITGEIASLNEPNCYYDISQFYALIKLNDKPDTGLSSWDKKMILTKTLSCEEESSFVDSYYSEITQLLNSSNYSQTKNKLIEIANDYNWIVAGKPYKTAANKGLPKYGLDL